jgi:alcohol dehydrogenase (cytochrome c)
VSPTAYVLLLVAAAAFALVTYEDLLKADPQNWLSYSGSYHSKRHSALDQIHTGNVGNLVAAWVHHIPGASRLESVPVVVNGVMYVSQPNEVYAIDGRSGRLIWEYHHQPALRKGPNRGVAVLGTKVYVGTPDAHLVALDARTGSLVWKAKLAEASDGY